MKLMQKANLLINNFIRFMYDIEPNKPPCMYFGLGFSCSLVQSQVQVQAQRQKLSQKLLLSFKQLLTQQHSDIPNATKGFEGMLVADRILKEKESVGILVGSVARDIWSQNRTEEQLSAHRDVDVMVLNPNFKLSNPCEGGIDWFLLKQETINCWSDIYGKEISRFTWWQNAFGAIVPLKIDTYVDLTPGLYLPSREVVINADIAALFTRKDPSVEFEESKQDMYDFFEKRIKTRLPKFVRTVFGDRILSNSQLIPRVIKPMYWRGIKDFSNK